VSVQDTTRKMAQFCAVSRGHPCKVKSGDCRKSVDKVLFGPVSQRP